MTINDIILYTKMQSKKHDDLERQAWYRNGLVCATIANANSKEKFTVNDFLPESYKIQAKIQTPEEMYQVLKIITLASGGEVIE